MNFDVPQLAIDIETLSSGDKAVITAFSATVFHFKKDADLTYKQIFDKTFYAKLDVKDQIKRFNRETDKKTIDWWKKQPIEVQEMSIKAKPDDMKVDEMVVKFKKYIEKFGVDFHNSYVWTRGIAYDIPKVENLIKTIADSDVDNAYNITLDGYVKDRDKYMLNTFRARDIRTFHDLVADTTNGKWEFPGGNPAEFVEHHARHDIALDVAKLIKLYNS